MAIRILTNDDKADTEVLIWLHALAIGYSPAYRTEKLETRGYTEEELAVLAGMEGHEARCRG